MEDPYKEIFTYNKDIDREILSKLNDFDLLKACSVNRYTWKTLCNETFFKKRMNEKYPGAVSFKKDYENWRQYFLRVVRDVDKLKTEFDFDFKSGDPREYYKILRIPNPEFGLIKAAEANLTDLVKYFRDVTYGWEHVLANGIVNNNKEIIDIALNKGAEDFDSALFFAAASENEELIRLFLDKNADIDEGLQGAAQAGNRKWIDYFISQGANDWKKAANRAIMGGHIDLFFEFIKKAGNNIDLEDLASTAAKNGNLEILKFLVEEKGFTDFDSIMYSLILHPPKNIEEVFDYIESQGYKNWEDWVDLAQFRNKELVPTLNKRL